SSASIVGAKGLVVAYGVTVGSITGIGSGLTSLTAANISAGTLGTSVVASSIAVNAVYPGAVSAATYANITGVGAQSQDLSMNTHKITGLVNPTASSDAATKQY